MPMLVRTFSREGSSTSHLEVEDLLRPDSLCAISSTPVSYKFERSALIQMATQYSRLFRAFIIILDSLGGRNSLVIQRLSNWLRAEASDKQKVEMTSHVNTIYAKVTTVFLNEKFISYSLWCRFLFKQTILIVGFTYFIMWKFS